MKRVWVDVRKDTHHQARERAAARKLRNSDWWRRRIADGICHYCGGEVGKEALTMDHLVPVARGGRSNKGNVVPACQACNRDKGVLTPAECILAQLEREEAESGNHLE